MPSYSIYKFDNFPKRANFKAEQQMDLLGYTEHSTEFKYLHDVSISEEDSFEKYIISHFQEVSFKGTPYSHGEIIDEVTELHKFEAYKNIIGEI